MPRAPVTPRLMTKAEAAAYCSFTPEQFEVEVKAGRFWPTPFAADRFDRHLLASILAQKLMPAARVPDKPARRVAAKPRVLRVKPWASSPRWAKLAYFNARKNSEKRGIEFTLTREDMDAIVARCDGRCEISGIPFDHEAHASAARRPFAPSLDRRDSAKGYEPENVRIICVIANLALNEWGDETLVTLARAIVAKAGLA